MCGGVIYEYEGKPVRVFFPNPYARLPIMKKGGGITLLPWGRRKDEPGHLPRGGWARLDTIKAGRWDAWQPRPVKLQVQRFMEKDIQGESHWFELTRGQWIQGLIARLQQEERVYVVTITPQMPDAVHDRWPRIMAGINPIK